MRAHAPATGAAALALLLAFAGPLAAQRAPGALPLTAIDSLLAEGRLAAAERALYAAVAARPRAPEARGALAWYLATRGRFVIADVLFAEALRFGADSDVVAGTRAVIAPYRAARPGPRVTVPFQVTEDARTIGRFEARSGDARWMAVLDPNARGFVVASAEAARRLGRALSVGERSLPAVQVAVDPRVAPGEVRLGFDVLYPHAPLFDERERTLTLGADDAGTPSTRGTPGGAMLRSEVPFVLAMPGLWLVERPGWPPAAAEGPRGRALLRGARWWLDTERSVVVIER